MQHNKRRTELHRLQAKHPELARRIEREELRDGPREPGGVGDDDDTSSSSDDEVRSPPIQCLAWHWDAFCGL